MTENETVEIESPEATEALAARLAPRLAAGGIVFLNGPLGAGKTLFAKAFFSALGADPRNVTSPTFQLIHRYRGGAIPLHHVDLYRIEDPTHIESLALDEILDLGGVTLIEWAERAEGVIGEPDLRIEIEDLGGDRRRFGVSFRAS